MQHKMEEKQRAKKAQPIIMRAQDKRKTAAVRTRIIFKVTTVVSRFGFRAEIKWQKSTQMEIYAFI